ncbi:protein-export membrane protein SecD [Natronomonas pharaonis DSM 2160]|uniref:Protein-export membrane protein SecD n=1 Tax=Natronomonas pharaonis (strain ATCC 35678 / DSM 2160 / CIP 103997 / JCM 8858 / NBRC 14720 / NCIMB 2260 / Gabara) TaxID=348780 RepID=A0A1U7EW94_NATPD|nr:preprotein translocase subunit SecD [Natronomonas pharaonis]CAI49352.1 protein-export membrane protein SecD [Natronomonas pharaonis DSM 2160]
MNLQLKKHWRIWLLVVFVLISTVALFGPLGDDAADEPTGDAAPEIEGEQQGDEMEAAQPDGDPDGEQPVGQVNGDVATASQITNLQFGLELSGGTQVRAPFIGMTVSNLEFGPDEQGDIEQTLQDELDLGTGDVRADAEDGTVEVFQDEYVGGIERSDFAAAMQEAGYSVDTGDVGMGVTGDTRDGVEDVLNDRLRERGLGGGSAAQVSAPGQQFMVVEVPGADRETVVDLIGERGQVEIWALFPGDDGDYETRSLLDQDDLADIGQARQDDGYYVPIRLDEQAGPRFGQAMRDHGFDQDGGVRCNYDLSRSLEENLDDEPGRCLMTVLDGEVVFAAGVNPNLSSSFASGAFDDDPSYRTTTTSFEDARDLEINMRAGALRTELDIDNRGTSFFLLPSLAERFKALSLVTGAAAIFAVAVMVFFRYRKPEVAAPMLLTAGSEVYILLGFAAAVGLPLDLSHIAGFIAVIGTGVDDLVIIADEIMQQGDVSTSKVFESRFKKAFWVIGAAAATTILAMSPLAVLSLGDLQGFAIITIVGVLIGVLITRPAYGDILRILVLEDD